MVRLRWVFTDQPFLPVGTQCVINNRIWNEDYYSDLAVGQLPLAECDYVQDARWQLPAFKFDGHQCHPEWFAVGEPWPVPSSLPPTVSLAGWVPECCVMACDFEDCSRTPVNGQPASQQRQYPIQAVEAVPTTPFRQTSVEVAHNTGGGNWPARVEEWFPGGVAAPAQYVVTDLTQPDGTPVSRTERLTLAGGAFIEEQKTASGWATTFNVGGVAFTFNLTTLAGQGRLTGTNLKIDPALLPPGSLPATFDQPTPAGTTVFDATPLIATDNVLQANPGLQGIKIPNVAFGAWETISVNNPSFTNPARFYAGDAGAAFYDPDGTGILDYVDLAPGDVIVVRQTNPGRFTILAWYNYATPGGGGTFADLNVANVFTQPQTIRPTTAGTNAVETVLEVDLACSGAPGPGFGAAVTYKLDSDNNTQRDAGGYEFNWFDATDATRKARFNFYVFDTAKRTLISGRASGTAPMLAFFGAAPVTQPTGSTLSVGFTQNSGTAVLDGSTFSGLTGGSAYTIDAIVTALKRLGLIAA